MVSQTLKEFMENVVDQKNGFKLGEPWRYSEKSLGVVIPILRETQIRRDYITQQETKDEVKITDQGTISKLKVKSDSDKDVFIRAGTIFKGDTQERGLTASVVIEAKSGEVEIPVKCVHASKGIRTGTPMRTAESLAPHSVTMALFSGSQRDTWNSVSRYSMAQSRSGEATHTAEQMYSGGGYTPIRPTLNDNLLQNMEKVEKFKGTIDDMLKKVPLFESQVGAIIFDFKGILGVELFESPKSWEAIHKEIIKKYSDSITQEQAEPIFELRKDVIEGKIKEFFQKLMVFEEKTVALQHNSETKSIQGENVIGEYTLLRDKIIHFLALRKEA